MISLENGAFENCSEHFLQTLSSYTFEENKNNKNFFEQIECCCILQFLPIYEVQLLACHSLNSFLSLEACSPSTASAVLAFLSKQSKTVLLATP